MRLLLVLGLLCCVGFSTTQDAGAKLLASKNILNEWLVEGRDLTIRYSIYNVGSRYVSLPCLGRVQHW